jgi:hypothetical protein
MTSPTGLAIAIRGALAVAAIADAAQARLAVSRFVALAADWRAPPNPEHVDSGESNNDECEQAR